MCGDALANRCPLPVASTEKFLYMPHTFMVTDHKQTYRGDDNLTPDERAAVPVETLWLEEERRRLEARTQIFPDLPPYVLLSPRVSLVAKSRAGSPPTASCLLCRDVIVFANFNQVSSMCDASAHVQTRANTIVVGLAALQGK